MNEEQLFTQFVSDIKLLKQRRMQDVADHRGTKDTASTYIQGRFDELATIELETDLFHAELFPMTAFRSRLESNLNERIQDIMLAKMITGHQIQPRIQGSIDEIKSVLVALKTMKVNSLKKV